MNLSKNINGKNNPIEDNTLKSYSVSNTEPKIQLIKNTKMHIISSNKVQPAYFINHQKKRKKIILSETEKKKRVFNRLYGLSDDYTNRMKKIRHEKKLSLTDHQNELMKLATNLGKEHVMKLLKEFKTLRLESSLTVPLPPINYKEIVEDSKRDCIEDIKVKKLSLRDRIRNSSIEKPLSEEEARDIQTMKNYRKAKANPSLMKMYEILPEHIVEIFAGRKR